MEKNVDIRLYHERQRADDAIKRLARIKGRLTDICTLTNNEKLPKYTGWYILLKESDMHPSGYTVLCIFNPDASEEHEEPEWDFAIPIKCKDDIKEFTGW